MEIYNLKQTFFFTKPKVGQIIHHASSVEIFFVQKIQIILFKNKNYPHDSIYQGLNWRSTRLSWQSVCPNSPLHVVVEYFNK